MTDINTMFTRRLLSMGVAEVKKHFPKTRILKDAWVWHAGRGHWEFHGPENYYWHGRAGDAYEARYKGWMAWLQHKGIDLDAKAED